MKSSNISSTIRAGCEEQQIRLDKSNSKGAVDDTGPLTACHLSEDEDTTASLLEPFEQLVDHGQFTTIVDEVFAQRIQAAIFDTFKQIWMALTMPKQLPCKTTAP
jgi:hypothetical protein